jgi:muramoyltetrapeptide carboxypeptidase
MNRRDLLKGIVAVPMIAQTMFSQKSTKAKMIKPKRLQFGDTVGLIAPAGYVDDEEFETAVQNIEKLGFKVKKGKHTRKRYNFLAGTDKERLEDLHWAFSDTEIKAVWCIRGGYGVTRILPNIDFNLIKKNPKIIIGYSDITALLLAIHQQTNLVTFHGPVASSDYNEYTKKHCLDVLMNPVNTYKIELSAKMQAVENPSYKTEIIAKGKAKGKLIGGNLTLLSAMAGTQFGIKNLKGKILFIEDINEPPYKVDRMLTQLMQISDFRQLAGIACGVFTESLRRNNPENNLSEIPDTTTIDVLNDRVGKLGIPVIYGLSFGHIREQFTLPIGIDAELDTENKLMTFRESGVV